MHGSVSGVYQVGTITVGASSVETITPCQSNVPFRELNLVAKPIEPDDNVAYTVTVLFDGEIMEQHSYPDADDRVICIMSYPDKIFPPNISTNTIPAFVREGAAPNPLVITIQIENLEGARRTYEVYSTFEEYDNFRFKRFNFDEED